MQRLNFIIIIQVSNKVLLVFSFKGKLLVLKEIMLDTNTFPTLHLYKNRSLIAVKFIFFNFNIPELLNFLSICIYDKKYFAL